jgi:hypothetical protein
MLASEAFQPLGHRAFAEIRSTLHDNPSRLAAGVRIDDANGLHECGLVRIAR